MVGTHTARSGRAAASCADRRASMTILLRYGSVALLVLVIIAALSTFVRMVSNGVAPMPSSGRVRARMVELLRQLQPVSSVVELGSGWGGLSILLSRAMPTATVTGYENSFLPYCFSLILRRLFRARNLRLVRRDFHKVSLRDADLVVCYLSPSAMRRLQPKFEAELDSSAAVVSITFALPEWRAVDVAVANDLYRTRIYLYFAGWCRSDALVRNATILRWS